MNARDATEGLPPLGFISVDVHFPRPPGDPFNPHSWPFPLIHERAEGSTESQIVTGGKYDDALIDRFVDAGMRLAERGCVGIITSCGFVVVAQDEISSRLPIPVSTSSLLQLPSLLSLLPPHKTIGILTYDSARLGPLHLQQLGIDTKRREIPIRGAPTEGHLRTMIQRGGAYVHADIEAELVEMATGLAGEYNGRDDDDGGDPRGRRPEIAALLLECTQMPPFAEAIQRATGLPVYDVYTMGMWFYSGLVSRTPQRWRLESS